MTKMCKKKLQKEPFNIFFSQMPLKVICQGCPMTKTCIYLFIFFGGGSKNAQNSKKYIKIFFFPNAPKSHLGVSNDNTVIFVEVSKNVSTIGFESLVCRFIRICSQQWDNLQVFHHLSWGAHSA